MLPTNPPPPMMLTFMGVLALQCCHDLFRDQLHEFVQVWSLRTAIATRRRFFNVSATKRIVRAQVAILTLVKPLVVVTKPFLQSEQFLRLLIVEIVHPAQLLRQDQDSAIGVDNLAVPVRL